MPVTVSVAVWLKFASAVVTRMVDMPFDLGVMRPVLASIVATSGLDEDQIKPLLQALEGLMVYAKLPVCPLLNVRDVEFRLKPVNGRHPACLVVCTLLMLADIEDVLLPDVSR